MRVQAVFFMTLPFLLHGAARADDRPPTLTVQAGDISATALGEGARASINIGAAPGQAKPGCGAAQVKVGHIRKMAVGANATASVNLPATSIDCEEKHP